MLRIDIVIALFTAGGSAIAHAYHRLMTDERPEQATVAPIWESVYRGANPGLPRVFRTADFASIYAASCEFRYSVRTSCGVR